jgi:uncharacterized protein YkwD
VPANTGMRTTSIPLFSFGVLLATLLSASPGNSQTRDQREQEDLSIERSTEDPSQADRERESEESIDLREAAERIVQATNRFRKRKDRQPVAENAELNETARYFAEFMAENDKYGHTADGQRPSERASDHGYDYCIVSENIAYQYSSLGFEGNELPRKFVAGWRKSPEHRKNMLDRDVTETGVAIAKSKESNTYYAVQMFGRPRSAAIEFAIRNESSQMVRYSIGDRIFPLPARATRTHKRCRPPNVVFFEGAESGAENGEENVSSESESPKTTVQPKDGDRFIVERGPEGWRVAKQQTCGDAALP